MSSLKMHMAISKKIKDELNYSDIFLLGAILPDIIKLLLGDRKISHFEKDGIIDLNRFINMQNNIDNELVLGYYAHLIEDKIWYELYMTKKYLKSPVYSDWKLYNDYAFVDNILYNDLNIDMNTQNISEMLHKAIKKMNIKDICLTDSKIENNINNDNIKNKINEVWKNYYSDGNNYFYNINDAKEYYQLTLQKVKECLTKLKNI